MSGEKTNWMSQLTVNYPIPVYKRVITQSSLQFDVSEDFE